MLCDVVLLRSRGSWITRSAAAAAPMHRGWLDYRRADPAHWGQTMQARLLAVRDLERDLLPQLQFARVLTIKEGGVLVQGKEIHTRGVKSKPEHRLQTWWCMTQIDMGLAALARMDVKSSTGFHVNDDDDEAR